MKVQNVIEERFTGDRSLIVIRHVRVNDETEVPGTVNWCYTNIRSKRNKMTVEYGKLFCFDKNFDKKTLTMSWLDLKPAVCIHPVGPPPPIAVTHTRPRANATVPPQFQGPSAAHGFCWMMYWARTP